MGRPHLRKAHHRQGRAARDDRDAARHRVDVLETERDFLHTVYIKEERKRNERTRGGQRRDGWPRGIALGASATASHGSVGRRAETRWIETRRR